MTWLFERAVAPLDVLGQQLVAEVACPDCGAELHAFLTEEPALLRHGGLRRRTLRRSCIMCGWSVVTEVSEVRP